MTVTFVGDVHGWSERLDAVLAQAEGEVVLMGDLIDRGPDTPGVIDRVYHGCSTGRMRCILGNHEFAMLRGIGATSIGLEADPHWFRLWRDRHGGDTVLASYDACDARTLRERLGPERIAWLASLPWYLSGDGWIAVHAGMLPGASLDSQLRMLEDGWTQLRESPEHLYDKLHVLDTPPDLPDGCVLVSGHLPLDAPLVSARRILCDTSGGRPGRRLSGVIWPTGRVIAS